MSQDITPAAKTSKTAMAAVGIVAFILGVAVGGTLTAEDPTTTEPTQTAADPEPAAVAEPEPEPEPQFDRPTKDDFKLKIRKVEENCFGSAGCNATLRVEVGLVGDVEFDPTRTYELRYRIIGGDDPLLATTEFTGRDYTVNEHFIGTPSADAQLRAVVLSVSDF